MKPRSPIILAVFILFFIFLLIFIDIGTLFVAYQNKDYTYLSTGVGTSMEPTIHNGDMLIILEKYSPEFDLDVGDIVVYWYTDDNIIGHRIIDIRNDKYLVQGDANLRRDNILVEDDMVVGKIIGVIDNGNIIAKVIVDLYI